MKRKSYNTGKWPKELSLDSTLFEKHESIPYNPRMADVFYKSGEIESWGNGFLKIKTERFIGNVNGFGETERFFMKN